MSKTVAEVGEPCSNHKASSAEGRRNEARLRKLVVDAKYAATRDSNFFRARRCLIFSNFLTAPFHSHDVWQRSVRRLRGPD